MLILIKSEAENVISFFLGTHRSWHLEPPLHELDFFVAVQQNLFSVEGSVIPGFFSLEQWPKFQTVSTV